MRINVDDLKFLLDLYFDSVNVDTESTETFNRLLNLRSQAQNVKVVDVLVDIDRLAELYKGDANTSSIEEIKDRLLENNVNVDLYQIGSRIAGTSLDELPLYTREDMLYVSKFLVQQTDLVGFDRAVSAAMTLSSDLIESRYPKARLSNILLIASELLNAASLYCQRRKEK